MAQMNVGGYVTGALGAITDSIKPAWNPTAVLALMGVNFLEMNFVAPLRDAASTAGGGGMISTFLASGVVAVGDAFKFSTWDHVKGTGGY